ncbi:apolipoprotein N-acyltransferase [Kozakia baliensis]|uniref:Apolipoprotein N-acyltransferase n=1 Tax=Kozakia baliensis TaxID=153496 RepID=A0A1D8UVI0_9PROT|nr:apolipoprotein N-acyltransferase [Kozakia baliensis]AOX17651.1 apolipoprotein N-acyltransferase [Kozakia baliensis]GEL62857.1 apolipoprotein N-acyltransferase [Kozakia baliensis]
MPNWFRRGPRAEVADALPWHGWRLVVALLLAGALAAATFPPVFALPLLSIGLLFLYRCAEDAGNWKRAAWCGFWFGLGFHTAGLYWLTDAILTRVHEYWWAVPIASPGCALILAPFAAFPAALCRYVAPGWRRMFLFAGSWTLADMGRIFLFSGFPWNPVGSALEWPGKLGDTLIQPASVIGVDGLTLATVLTALLIWRGRRWAVGLFVLWAAWGGWGAYRLAHIHVLPTINPVLALTQGNISEKEVLSQKDAIASFQRYLRLTTQGITQARRDYPDRAVAYVWPESGFPGLLDEDDIARRMIARAADGTWGVIGSDRRDGHGHWFNSAIALDESGNIAAIYDKSTLVPFGEYQPRFIPFNLLPGQLTPGLGLKTWNLPILGAVGPMVCYEVIFSGRVTGKTRPDWLLNITNDAWFGDSAGPRQHLATARMRAVEEGLPVAQDANTGISAVYSAVGQETARLGWGREGVLVAALPSPLPPTFFAGHGRLTPFILTLICMALSLFPFRKRYSRL